jgi:hypothetical protein
LYITYRVLLGMAARSARKLYEGGKRVYALSLPLRRQYDAQSNAAWVNQAVGHLTRFGSLDKQRGLAIMLGILIGLLPIGLGIKAFTRDGLPLTRSKNLKGAGAKAIGVICILVGIAFIAEGAFSAWLYFRGNVLASPDRPPAPVATLPAAASQAWVTHECPQGGYSLLMPGTPTEEESPGNPAIALLGGHMSILDKGDGRAYMAKCSRFSAERSDVKKELDAARDNIVVALGGTLRTQKDIQIAESPGRELVLSLPDKTAMRTRYFLVGKNLFQIMAVVPQGQESSSETNSFFDSFKLLADGGAEKDGDAEK